MTRVLFALAALALAVYACLCVALLVFQRSFIYFPQPRSQAGSNAATLALPTEDGDVQVSLRDRQGDDAVIYFGGNAEDVAQSQPGLEAAFPDHALYLMNYRGYGGSAGKPSEAALFADSLALYDRMRSRHSRIVLVGRSLGSGVAVHLASLRPVQRLVLVTPYNSLTAMASQQFPWVPVRLLLRDRFASDRYAGTVGVPTLLIAAANDEVIPRANTDRLLAAFRPGVATMAVVPGSSHNTIGNSAAYLQLLRGAPSR